MAGQVVSQTGNWLLRVGQSLLVLHLTNDGFAVGVVTACEFLPMLLFGAWTGLVADRSNKRRLLMIVQAFAMLQSCVIAGLAFLDRPPLLGVYVAALVGGCVSAFDFPLRRSFVVEMVAVDDVHNAISLNTAVMNLARVVGPALAGLLVTTVGYGLCFTANALSYIAALAGLFLIDPSELSAARITVKAERQIRAGLIYARSVPDVWVPLVVVAIVGILAYNFQVVLPLVVTRTYDGSVASFTLLYSVLSVGSLIGALAAARRRSVHVLTVVVTCAIFGVTMLMFAAVPSLAWSFPVILLVGWASTYFMTAASAIVQVNASSEMQGRVSALQIIVVVGSTPLGGPILGLICDRYGARTGLLVGGIGALLAASWGQFATRPARSQPHTKLA